MDTQFTKQCKWFWPWQDDKEETWLMDMSRKGMHLTSIGPPCNYTFRKDEPRVYTYRLDYMLAEKKALPEYLQIFQDAGWEYIGEQSNWRYWRKLTIEGETDEIFTDTESKQKKYRRLLTMLSLILVILVVLGSRLVLNQPWIENDKPDAIVVIYLVGRILYTLLIPFYAFVVVKLLRRIDQLQKKNL